MDYLEAYRSRPTTLYGDCAIRRLYNGSHRPDTQAIRLIIDLGIDSARYRSIVASTGVCGRRATCVCLSVCRPVFVCLYRPIRCLHYNLYI